MSRKEVVKMLGPANTGDGTGVAYDIADIYWLAAAPNLAQQVGYFLQMGTTSPSLWVEYKADRVQNVSVR